MADEARWLTNQAPFKHRGGIEAVLRAGGSLRKDDRVHKADHLAGLYKIRLNIASDTSINPGGGPIVDDLTEMVTNLEERPTAQITAWFIHSVDDTTRYWVFEDLNTGDVLACLHFDHKRVMPG